MLKNSDNKEPKLYVITNTNEAFSLFLLILDNINQKRKLHANNTRNHRVSQVSLHICARARKKPDCVFIFNLFTLYDEDL